MKAPGAGAAAADDAQQFSIEAVQSNLKDVTYIRTVMAIASGMAAGTLSLTGYKGFLFYAAMHAIVSAAIVVKMRFKAHECIPRSSNVGFVFAGMGDNITSYILFWTLSYALVHIY